MLRKHGELSDWCEELNECGAESRLLDRKKIRTWSRETEEVGRINKEERDHTEHSNPRELSTVALYLSPFSLCYISSSLHPHSIWKSAETLHARLFSHTHRPPARDHPAVRSTAALWRTPLLQSPSFCCTVAFFMTINLHDVTTAHGSDCCYGDQYSSSIPNCCLRESVCKLTIAHVFVCACSSVGLCARFIFNCYLQSAYWAQSVIRKAQRGVNSWDSFTSVLMDFLYLCLSFPFLSLALILCQSFSLSLHLSHM